MTRVITILSGKGGVGKTVSAINLGAALAKFNKDVVVVDTNLTTPNVGLYLGVPLLPITLHDVLKGKNHITEAVYLHKSGVKIVPASISLSALRKLNPDRLSYSITGLIGLTDYVILDSAAGLGREALSALEIADDVIVVTNPELAAVTDALKTIKLAEEFDKNVLGVILTRTNPKHMDLPLREIEAMLEKPIIGIIPEDKAVNYSLSKKEPVVHLYPKSASATSYKKLAANLIGHKYEEESPKEEKNFTYYLLRFFGLR